ncbi:MAG: DUF433 domain-containing protein [Hormoscilla sp. SP5CHS1]|nr:DUF433 domain-containing protein [Hormoscilla sp. SP12CHS1]MBC6453126.1 DUF433 domain-containing protein [Hormoscilla sp. SP5CHS1]
MPMKNKLIESSPDIMSGTPVFAGTRVPAQTLIDYLAAGESLDEFIYDFPTVSRDRAIAVLNLAMKSILQNYEAVA